MRQSWAGGGEGLVELSAGVSGAGVFSVYPEGFFFWARFGAPSSPGGTKHQLISTALLFPLGSSKKLRLSTRKPSDSLHVSVYFWKL